jgi:hypothetical protein
MTEPRNTQRGLPADAAADPEPEVEPKAIQDLDVTGDCSWTQVTGNLQ